SRRCHQFPSNLRHLAHLRQQADCSRETQTCGSTQCRCRAALGVRRVLGVTTTGSMLSCVSSTHAHQYPQHTNSIDAQKRSLQSISWPASIGASRLITVV
ncbi:unnamed protein product, partial [Ectocarpus sp. 8 AP-2014]